MNNTHDKLRQFTFQKSKLTRLFGGALLGCLLFQPAFADYTGNGDIVGTIENGGNPSSDGDIIVGDVGTAGVFGDGALPLVGGNLYAIRSDDTVFGNEPGSIGAVTLEDFLYLDVGETGDSSPTGGNWFVEENLSVGNNGTGLLDLNNSARLTVAETTWIGGSDGSGVFDSAVGSGYGLVTVNGTGSRLVTGESLSDDFIVGHDGLGDVEVSGRGSIQSNGNVVVGNEDGADGRVMLTDRGSLWTIAGDLAVGNGTSDTTAVGRVEISDSALVQVESTVTINSRGSLIMQGGTMKMLPTTESIVNEGLISGDGLINAGMEIGATGKLKNASAQVFNGPTVVNLREHLMITGVVENEGLIHSSGGSMEFQSAVTNENEIIIQDALMTFNDDFVNETTGNIVLGGESTMQVLGANPISNEGDIHVLAGSAATIVGDLVFSGGSLLSLTVGPDAGTIDVIGDIDISGAELELEYSSGVFANAGDTYKVLDATEDFSSMFTNTNDEVVDENGQVWDIVYNASSVWVTATGAISTVLDGDFDSDDDVDGFDFLTWQRGFGTTTDASDLADWESNYGTGISAVSVINAVPEPSTLALVVLSLGCFVTRRRA